MLVCNFNIFLYVMEVAILAALGILGYELRGKRAPSHPNGSVNSTRLNNQYPFHSQTRLQQVQQQEEQAIRTNLQRCAETPGQRPDNVSSKPFHNNMVPFFGSAGSQNTNDSVKTRRLETFTGTDDDSFSKKIEQLSLFRPGESRATTSGMPSLSETERFSTFASSTFHTNVNADPQSNQTIGPGIGMGYEDGPRGGFHPESVVRVLPNNVNSYRLNELDSFEAIAGHSHVEARQTDLGNVRGNEIDTYYSQAQHPTMPTGGVQSAPKVNDIMYTESSRYQNGTPDWGIPGFNSGHQGSNGEVYTRKSVQCNSHPGAPSIPIGNTQNGEWNMPQQSRANQNFACEQSNLKGTVLPSSREFSAPTTLRETLGSQDSPIPYHSLGNRPGIRPSATDIQLTSRNTLPTVDREAVQTVFPSSYVPPGVCTLPGRQLENANTTAFIGLSRQGAGTNTGLGHVHINSKVTPENINSTHGQFPNQHIDPNQQPQLSCSIDDDSCFRSPGIGRSVYRDRGAFGEVELK
jgi:hypothetical protein